jgi:hypothetical protein
MSQSDVKITRNIINLAGSLGWNFRNGKSGQQIKKIIKELRTNITKVETIIDNEIEHKSGKKK